MAMPSQPASRQRLMELVREGTVGVAGEPIVVAEPGADLEDRFADLLLGGREGKVHGPCSMGVRPSGSDTSPNHQ